MHLSQYSSRNLAHDQDGSNAVQGLFQYFLDQKPSVEHYLGILRWAGYRMSSGVAEAHSQNYERDNFAGALLS